MSKFVGGGPCALQSLQPCSSARDLCALALMYRRVACLSWLCIGVLRDCETIAVRAVAFELDPVSFRSTSTVSRAGEFTSMVFTCAAVLLLRGQQAMQTCRRVPRHGEKMGTATDAGRRRGSAAPSYDPKRSNLVCGYHAFDVIKTYIDVPYMLASSKYIGLRRIGFIGGVLMATRTHDRMPVEVETPLGKRKRDTVLPPAPAVDEFTTTFTAARPYISEFCFVYSLFRPRAAPLHMCSSSTASRDMANATEPL